MSADFVACMEDVLDLYCEPYDPERPVVCFDETSKQWWQRRGLPSRPREDGGSGLISSTNAMEPGTCSCCASHWPAGGTWQ